MEVKKDVIGKAVLLTALLFAASMYAGYQIESVKYAESEARISELEAGIENSLLFSMFLRTHSDSSVCGVLKSQLDETAQHTYNLYGELEEAGSTSVFRNYGQLRKKYFLANMRFYLMLREYKQSCNDTELEPVLFFYSAYNECPQCVAQGRVLDSVRYECPEVRVYAFPADAQEIEMIRTFKSYYRIEETPSMVVRDRTYPGLVPKDEIKSIVGCG